MESTTIFAVEGLVGRSERAIQWCGTAATATVWIHITKLRYQLKEELVKASVDWVVRLLVNIIM